MEYIPTTSVDREIGNTFEAIGGARALTCWLLFKYQQHDDLVQLTFDPESYNNIVDARAALAATSLLSKATFLKTSVDKRATAIEKFRKAEEVCTLTNHRIRRSFHDYGKTATIIEIAARKIRWCLGSFRPDEFIEGCEFGPGASTSLKRREASKPNKYVLSKDVTPEAYWFIKDWFGVAYPEMDDYIFSIRRESVVTTVPKNSKTDRVIAIEPDWNIFFQKGLGAMIRRRLRGVGIDLNDQSINQELARQALALGLSTIDFSAASDTISLAVVEELIPQPWLTVCKAFRSSYTRLDGEEMLLSKFSSMGNGYTFELESLIFWALASACAEYSDFETAVIGVYGDDVILPDSLVEMYTLVCSDLGFSVNKSNSFTRSYFRESCGSYYWAGVDIKPMYIKDVPDDSFTLIRIANAVRLLSTRGHEGYCDKRFRACWHHWARLAKDAPRVPVTLGDAGLIVNLNELDRLPRRAGSRYAGWEGWLVKCWTEKSMRHYCASRGLLTVRLRDIGNEAKKLAGNTVSLPECTERSITTSLVPRWRDVGEWV